MDMSAKFGRKSMPHTWIRDMVQAICSSMHFNHNLMKVAHSHCQTHPLECICFIGQQMPVRSRMLRSGSPLHWRITPHERTRHASDALKVSKLVTQVSNRPTKLCLTGSSLAEKQDPGPTLPSASRQELPSLPHTSPHACSWPTWSSRPPAQGHPR